MLVLPQVVNLKWNKRNIKIYEEKGYVYTNKGEVFTVHVLDLIKGDRTYIKVNTKENIKNIVLVTLKL
jgi:hypothetical protein